MIDQLFGSKTRVKLLKLFLSNPNRSFYVREMTRKIDEQINSVRRELANLLSIGIIKSDKVNNKLYYEVNQKSKYYDPMRQLFGNSAVIKDGPKSKKADGKPVKKVSPQLDMASQVKNLGTIHMALLTGSFTRDDTVGVDMLIVGDVTQARVNKFISKLEKDEGREILYTVMKRDEFDYRIDVNDRFLNKVLDSKYTVIVDEDNLLK